jgi:hypothetical protein
MAAYCLADSDTRNEGVAYCVLLLIYQPREHWQWRSRLQTRDAYSYFDASIYRKRR